MLWDKTLSRPEAFAIIDTGSRPGRFTSFIRFRNASYRQITFAQLEQASACAASLFRQQALRPGDAVLVLHPISIELYRPLLLLFRLPLIAMFLDPSAGRTTRHPCRPRD